MAQDNTQGAAQQPPSSEPAGEARIHTEPHAQEKKERRSRLGRFRRWVSERDPDLIEVDHKMDGQSIRYRSVVKHPALWTVARRLAWVGGISILIMFLIIGILIGKWTSPAPQVQIVEMGSPLEAPATPVPQPSEPEPSEPPSDTQFPAAEYTTETVKDVLNETVAILEAAAPIADRLRPSQPAAPPPLPQQLPQPQPRIEAPRPQPPLAPPAAPRNNSTIWGPPTIPPPR
jgi:hypothetical protein